jgi:long-chain acyl-CoA synthetase
LRETFENSSKLYKERPCFGKIENSKVTWTSYQEFFQRVQNFGSGLKKINPKGNVGLCSTNQLEWYISEYSCMMYSLPSIGIHCSFETGILEHVIENAEIETVICEKKFANQFLFASQRCKRLKNLIIWDISEEESKEMISDLNILTFNHVEEQGKDQPLKFSDNDKDDIFTIIYTSGSTGFLHKINH